MCLWTYEQNWEELKGKLNRNDVVKLQSLHDLCEDEKSVVDKLKYCTTHAVQLQLGDVVIDKNLTTDIIDLIHHEEACRKNELKKAQKIGIQRALEKRRTGVGTYGRPHVKLPEDFEEQVIRCWHNEQPLESYRRKTNLKRATFYKYARQVLK